MKSEWRRWADEFRRTWRVPDGTAYVVFPLFGGDVVEHDDGTWSPVEFTYVEMPDDPSLPYFVVECEHSERDLLPRIMAVHVIKRPASREVRSSDMRRIRLEDVIEDAWRQASRRPSTVQTDDAGPAELLSAAQREEEIKRTGRGLRSRARRKITDALLEEIASIYHTHLATGAPTKAVGEHFELAPSTASLYVKRARDAGKNMGPNHPPTTSTPTAAKGRKSGQHRKKS